MRSRQAGGHDLLEGARQVGVGASEEGPQAHAELEMKIKVGDNSLSDALLTIIHWPGWTLAEVRLVKAMVDTLQAHVFGVETVGQTLFKGDSSPLMLSIAVSGHSRMPPPTRGFSGLAKGCPAEFEAEHYRRKDEAGRVA